MTQLLAKDLLNIEYLNENFNSDNYSEYLRKDSLAKVTTQVSDINNLNDQD